MSIDKSIRILVVEDNEKIRDLIINILSSSGFTNVSGAENGVMAWELFQTEQPKLVLTDWMMPEMNGLELLMKIRSSSPEVKDTPVLMITASDKSEDIVSAAKWKINGYIVKPFSVKTILKKISEVIDN